MTVPGTAAHLVDMDDSNRVPAGTPAGGQFRTQSRPEADVGLDQTATGATPPSDDQHRAPPGGHGTSLGRAMMPPAVSEAVARTAYACPDPTGMREKGLRQAERDATVRGEDYVGQMVRTYAEAPVDDANFDHYRAGYERYLATTETVPAGDLAVDDQVLLPDEARTAVHVTAIEKAQHPDTTMWIAYQHPEHGTQRDQLDAGDDLHVLRHRGQEHGQDHEQGP